MLIIVILSFQGPEAGLTFPLRGALLFWFGKLAEGLGAVDIGAALNCETGNATRCGADWLLWRYGLDGTA